MRMHYTDIAALALALLFAVLHGVHGRWTAIGTLVVVAAVLLAMGQPVLMATSIAILTAHLVQLPAGRGSPVMPEHFANMKDEAKESSAGEDEHDDDDDKPAEDDEEDDEEDGVDMFKTMLESYKSLTPDQVEHMTKDTKDLIETQKSLMETVKSLAPVVTQGKEMLDTFKDYFGSDTKNMLGQAMKSLGGGRSKKSKLCTAHR